MTHFFILGKNSQLSIAEIKAVLKTLEIDFETVYAGQEILLLNFENEIDIKGLLQRLGGTIKIGQIVLEATQKITTDQLLVCFSKTAQKVFFGFSFYALDSESSFFKNIYQSSKALGMELKKALREKYNVSSRWVLGQEKALSSVIVAKNKLLTQGKEFCFFISQDKVYLGQTLAVQDFEEYGLLDFGRPNRDDRSGMLPPKLAKIMLNLTQKSVEATILDPFCGSGTVIQEAILLGYTNLIASDLSNKAIKDTKINLDWLLDRGLVQSFEVDIFQADATKISQQLDKNSIDAIVTEPYLGPPSFSDNQVDKIIEELSSLYLKTLQEFKQVLVSGGRVIMVMPIWRVGGQARYLPIIDEIKRLGFKQIDFGVNDKNESRSGLVYGRDNQRIVREIWGWEKKG
jgi:tRNA (guanine10-N2)-dimethyltransferase